MKNTKLITATATMIAVVFILFISSCKKDSSSSSSIDYTAAYVVNGGGNSISVIRLSDNTVTKTISLANIAFPHHINLSPDNSKIALGIPGMDFSLGHMGGMMGMTGKVLVLDAKTGTATKVVELPIMNHNSIFSANGKELWTAQMDSMGTVLVYDAATYTLKNTITVGMMPAEVTFSNDGTMAFVANGMSNDVTIIDVATKAVMATVAVGTNPVGAWTGSDNKMYVDNEDGQSISVISVASMSVVETIPLGFMPGMATYLGSMKELWVSDPSNGKVHWWVWDNSMSMYMHGGEIATGAGAHAIAFNGMTAYVTNQTAGTVSVCDVMAHTKTKDISVGSKPNGIVIKQ